MFRQTERRIGISYAMPIQCEVWLRITEAGGVSGPQVAMLVSLLMSALHVRIIHRASPAPSGTTKPDEIALTLPLVPANERVTRPSRSFRGPAGGSWMSLQMFDHERKPLSEEREIGVCADGIREEGLALVARVHPAAWLSYRSGREGGESLLRLDGELVFVSGILLRFRMRPLVAAPGSPGVNVEIPLASSGTTLHLADRLVERNFPGLPAILLAFLDADGRPIGHERLAHAHAGE